MARRRIGRLMVLMGLPLLTAGCPMDTSRSLQTDTSPAKPQPSIERAAEPASSEEAAPAAPESDAASDAGVAPGLETHASPSGILWEPPGDAGISTLSLRDPSGVVSRYEYLPGEAPYLDAAGLSDGLYVYELAVDPILDPGTVDVMEEVADDPELRESVVRQLAEGGYIPDERIGQWGSFMVASGTIVPSDTSAKDAAGGSDQDGGNFNKDQVINDDLIVSFSACIGNDCNNGESFGFDTLRLKENNLRIRFDDTSNSASFPNNDWQLTANDTSNGGQNRFSIDDITGGRTPFTVEAGAPSHSLYVDDGGRIGLGTSTPVVEIHNTDGDSPTLRLEQDGSSGFTPQTWDVAGNETNFFVRDTTNGSRLPFKIKPSAPTNSLFVNTNGDIGLGTASPSAKLHAVSSSATPAITLQSTAMNGSPRFNLDSSAEDWSIGIRDTDGKLTISNTLDLGTTANDALTIDEASLDVTLGRDLEVKRIVKWSDGFNQVGRLSFTGIGGNPAIIANTNKSLEFWTGTSGVGSNRMMISPSGAVTVNGNLTVNGTFSNPSDRNIKDAIESVDPKDVLEKVVGMPITSWRYRQEDESIRHLGPMAQDFMDAFGLGADDRYITSIDADGVSLAAIQGLNQKIEEKDAVIAEQARALKALADRVAALEKAAQN